MTDARPHLIAATILGLLTVVVHRRLPECWFYRDDFGFLAAARDTSFAEHLSGLFDVVSYWRPGQDFMVDAIHSVFGDSALAFLLFGLGQHLAVVGLGYWVVARSTGSVTLATLVGAVAITAPIAVEVVYWMAASTTSAPAFALLFFAGTLAISTLHGAARSRAGTSGMAASHRTWQTSSITRWSCIACLFVGSLTFREYAYQLPMLVFVASLTLEPRHVGAATLRALPFGIVIILHYTLLSVVTAPSGAALSNVGDLLQRYAGASIGDPDAGIAVSIGVGIVILLGLARGDARTRTFVCWTAFGTFPYLAKAYTDRYAYPLAVLAPIAMALTAARFGKAGRIGGAILLTMWCAWQVPRLEDALVRERSNGELCRAALAWCRTEDVTRFDHIAVDHLPDALLNGWPAMLDLYLGKRVEVAAASLIAVPPFAILPAGALPPTERTAFVRIEPSTREFTRVSRAEFVGGLVEVPLVALIDDYVIEPDATRARELASSGSIDLSRRVVIAAPPPIELTATAPIRDANRLVSAILEPPELRFELDIGSTCALVLHLPIDLVAAGARASVDGATTRLLQANGSFAALYLGPGRHSVVLRMP